MAGQNIIVRMDSRDKQRMDDLMTGILDGLSNMDPFWDAVEMHMIDSLTQNFEAEGRPTKWEPLAEWTINAKGSSTILQDTGALKGSINSQNTERAGDSLEIWAGEAHGLFHQYADQDPMSQFGMINKNDKYPMPMRPFMLFQEDDIDTIEEIAANYLTEISGG
jgi:phage gpG-like protein